MATIKKGSTLIVTLLFSDEEWAALYPWDDIDAFITQESIRHELLISMKPANKAVEVRGDTTHWIVGPAKFDVWVVKDGTRMAVPNGYDIQITIIQGGLTE